MFSPLALRRGKELYYLCWRLEDSRDANANLPTALAFNDALFARIFLRSCITNPEQENELRVWLQYPNPSVALNVIGVADIIGYAATLIGAGQLLVASADKAGKAEIEGIMRKGGEGKGSGSGKRSSRESTPLDDEMAKRESTPPKEEVVVVGEEEPEKTWIEIELFDKAGRPVPNERFKITLPDGSVKWGRLDSDARARIERLQPGTCKVTFPDRDEEVWDVE